MTSTAGPITSREYKLMLRAERFDHRKRGCRGLRELVEMLAGMHGGEVVRRHKRESLRTTRYLDTAGLALYRQGLVLRVRDEPARKRVKLTLKCRDPDRYIAAASPVLAAPGLDLPGLEASEKFEEDVLPPFRSNFSRSGVVEVRKAPALRCIADLAALFPGVGEAGLEPDEPLVTVNRFTAHEVMHRLAQLRFSGGPKVRVCVSLWYPAAGQARTPLAAEISYDFRAERAQVPESFDLQTCAGAGRLFRSLQKQTDWVQLGRTTKTSFAFGGV